jgi:hypothetical protein
MRVGRALVALALSACGCLGPAAGFAHAASGAGVEGLVASQAALWQSYTTPDGRIVDPLDPADSGDNYGVVLLADVMLRQAARSGDAQLAATAEKIVLRTAALPLLSGPFYLLALAVLLRDGERSYFPSQVWRRIGGVVAGLAHRIQPETRHVCLIEPGCYNNWRLVWAAGESTLLASAGGGFSALEASGVPAKESEIDGNLLLAMRHRGALAHGVPGGGLARELSDPGTEPQAYEIFSAVMLELVLEERASARTRDVERLRDEVDRYALAMMSPDGQLSRSGRSLDESWVQAGGVDLGLRRAEEGSPGPWRAFADRAFDYLTASYPVLPDGLLSIVPGLGSDWRRSIVDRYAAFAQYSGLTLWLLSDALSHMPHDSDIAPLPADQRISLVNDLRTSGTVWGRSGNVWWELQGRAAGADPRSAQGVVAVKLQLDGRWRDVLALRPLARRLRSTWTLTTARGRLARPVFTHVAGTGARAVLRGYWREKGRRGAPVTWTLEARGSGVLLSMSRPPGAKLQTTLWLAPEGRDTPVRAKVRRGACLVSASGLACPQTLTWTNAPAKLYLG